MIVRISNEGQFRLDDGLHGRLNELDDAAVTAVEAGDEDAFHAAFEELLQVVRTEGTELEDEDLDASDVILPPSGPELRRGGRGVHGRRADPRARLIAAAAPRAQQTGQLGADRRALARRARDDEPAAERLDAVGEAAQPGAAALVGAADAVVDDLDRARWPSLRSTRTRASRGLRVLGHVGQRLADDEVGRGLDRLGQALVERDVDRDGQRRDGRRRPRSPRAGRGR